MGARELVIEYLKKFEKLVIKICVIGPKMSGKTSLIRKYLNHKRNQ